jgi:hypothetical protein
LKEKLHEKRLSIPGFFQKRHQNQKGAIINDIKFKQPESLDGS